MPDVKHASLNTTRTADTLADPVHIEHQHSSRDRRTQGKTQGKTQEHKEGATNQATCQCFWQKIDLSPWERKASVPRMPHVFDWVGDGKFYIFFFRTTLFGQPYSFFRAILFIFLTTLFFHNIYFLRTTTFISSGQHLFLPDNIIFPDNIISS